MPWCLWPWSWRWRAALPRATAAIAARIAISLPRGSTHQQWDAAAEEFAAFLAQQPDHAACDKARFYLGEALVQQNRFREAQGHFDRYLANQPDGEFRRQALFRGSECAYLSEQAEEARRRLETFTETYGNDPLSGLVLAYRGELASRGGRAGEAESLFRQSLRDFPDGAFQDDCRLGLARALEAGGNRDEAERYYLALAAKKNSRLAGEAQFRLGALYYAAARYDAAIEAFSALEYEPADSWACSARIGQGVGAGPTRAPRGRRRGLPIDPRPRAAGNRSPLLGGTLPQGAIRVGPGVPGVSGGR